MNRQDRVNAHILVIVDVIDGLPVDEQLDVAALLWTHVFAFALETVSTDPAFRAAMVAHAERIANDMAAKAASFDDKGDQ